MSSNDKLDKSKDNLQRIKQFQEPIGMTSC